MDGQADSTGAGDEGAAGRGGGGDNPIDAVRELLFGTQLQGLEAQLRGMEGRVMGEIVQRTGQLAARLDELERLVRSEFVVMRRQLGEEQQARLQGDGEGVERDRVIDAKLETSVGAVREAMGEVARRLAGEIDDVRDDVMGVMRERVAELDSAMVKRGVFGEMLMDMGLRLQPEVEDEGVDGDGSEPEVAMEEAVGDWPFGWERQAEEGEQEGRGGSVGL